MSQASETRVPEAGRPSGAISIPLEWNLSLLQLQPVMSPPSGWLLGRQTQQLPGLEENAHCFNCWPLISPTSPLLCPQPSTRAQDGCFAQAHACTERRSCDGSPEAVSGEECLWLINCISQFWGKETFKGPKKPFYKLLLSYLQLKL